MATAPATSNAANPPTVPAITAVFLFFALHPSLSTRPSAQRQPRNSPARLYPHLPSDCSHWLHRPELRSQPTWNPARRALPYPSLLHAGSCASAGTESLSTGT
uniref:Secreted protein n=1 Tax=Arundo donax TaxID=35708 RepID=A0A0A9H8T8_ARUDO